MAVEIRLATARDARAVADIYGPIVASTPISFEIEPPDEREMQRRIEQTLQVYPWIVCEHDGRIIGYAYATQHRARSAYQWSVDTSVYVHSDFHRCGVGRGLYTSLFQILIAQGYFNAYAGITLPNPGSVGLHESVGFRPVGVYRRVGYKLGAWHDVGWWHAALQPSDSSPRPPVVLSRVQDDPSWDALVRAGKSCIRGAFLKRSVP
ncbi:arsinothricin resistance N-acetyltransferase ArsN1 family B [Limnochorda pilosa]|uniref:GCN5 family acetyltransferase n=1 Tax=Limnochorda pilosa TaxID=1555112 RepID=A0A0K2SIF1_LIMPI|nr:arsinothricin resistance N-acetyltransferase ArsN1 family B [Limnochorda pilosa]BAS26865.1 GCN5 family acetyltransferase [Limnochorda pilosa]